MSSHYCHTRCLGFQVECLDSAQTFAVGASWPVPCWYRAAMAAQSHSALCQHTKELVALHWCIAAGRGLTRQNRLCAEHERTHKGVGIHGNLARSKMGEHSSQQHLESHHHLFHFRFTLVHCEQVVVHFVQP